MVYYLLQSILIISLFYINPTQSFQPATAFTYTTKNEDFYENVTADGFKSVYVYGGDAELYCRGSGGSNLSTPCIFSGENINSYIYYTSYAQTAVEKFKNSGFSVYLNFDGRIGEYIPNFSLLTESEIKNFAAATAGIVCGENNAVGMGWDVEPFNNNQLPFFQELDIIITSCKKNWGIFAFGDTFSPEMWTNGLGKSGVLLDSTYDLPCPTCFPCKCVPPTKNDAGPGEDDYSNILTQHLQKIKNLAGKYEKPYQLFIAGSGTTQIYENCVLSDCSSMGGGIVYNQTCPWRMVSWLEAWVVVVNSVSVKTDPNFRGVAVYDWSGGSNGGFLPNEPEVDFIQFLKTAGFL